MPTTRTALVALVLLSTACNKSEPAPAAESPASEPKVAAPSAEKSAQAEAKPMQEKPSAVQLAVVGKPAPDFTLPDLDGNEVELSAHKGKVVVLEWFNPNCPYVKATHSKGTLVDAAERYAKDGVVYLAINSGASGKQGHGVEVNRDGAETFGMKHPILLDESGSTGRAYGATNTPHVYVINAEGVLVYAGAPDNSPDGEAESPEGGELVRYLDAAVTETLAGKPVSQPTSKAWGCSVKYGS